MTPPTRTILALALLAAFAASCSSDATPDDPLGSPALPSGGAAAASPTPGQQVWVAVLAEGPDEDALTADLEAAQQAVGDYLADRIVITEPSCFEGLDPAVEGPAIVAIRDTAEHGVHAMFLEVTDDPLFYGPVTLAC
jgi:hypothetical protein